MKSRGLLKAAYVATALGTTAALARSVTNGGTAALDERVTLRLQSIDNPFFDRVMKTVSWPGFPPQSRVIPWLIPGSMLAAGSPTEAGFQLLGWGTGAISGLIKRIMLRPRPDHPHIQVSHANVGGSSFPSGHVIIYTGVYGFLAYLGHIFIPYRWVRRFFVGGLAALIALVGPSRIYLGHHWASDVLASYALGTSYLAALTSLYASVKRHQTR